MTACELACFAKLCGDRGVPAHIVSELVIIAGRGSGKTLAAATLLIYFCYFLDFRVTPGQIPVALLLAATRDQSQVAFRFVKGLIESSPILSAEVVNITRQTIELRNGLEVSCAASDYRTVRGRSIVIAICDELAFWEITAESANPDSEVLTALRPGLARFRNSLLVCISSPYAQQGELYEYFRRYYGQSDARVLVAKGSTAEFNETFDKAVIADAYERDALSAAAEYGADFRSDRAGFVDAALLDSITRTEPRELPYRAMSSTGGHLSYFAGIDASGGRVDATGAAVFVNENGKVRGCAVRRWPAPHDPAVVAGEVAAFLSLYGLNCARADGYAAEFARTVYRDAGVSLTDAPDNRSETYLRFLPLMTTGAVELMPDPRLRVELLTLERRTARGGRDSVDHRVGSHDDVANCCALAAVAAARMGSASDGLVIAGRSTILDGLSGRNVEPAQRYASIFDRAADVAANPLNDPTIFLN